MTWRRFLLPIAPVAALACAKPYLAARVDAPPHPEAPAGVTHAVATFEGRGGVTLFEQSWRPAGEPRAVLVIMHGLRDHSDHYAPMAARLVARGYAVHAFDLRGHGRSAGRRVTVGAFADYVADLDTFVTRVRAAEPGKPVFLFGHSMGGAIVGLYAEEKSGGADAPAGIILSAPALRIDKPPIAAAALLLAGTLTPNAGALAASNDGFSSSPEVTADMGRDPLIFQPGGPAHTAAELVRGIERFWAGVDGLGVPMLLLHGTGDTLTAPAGSRDIYVRASSPDKTLRLYPGLRHDLVHEPQADEVVGDVVAWLDAHTGGPATTFPAPALAQRLDGDGLAPAIIVDTEAGFRRRGADGTAQDAAQGGGGELRARVLLGGRVAWSLGLDAGVGAFEGVTYRAALYPVGLALTSHAGHVLSVGFGGGLSDPGAHGGVGLGWELPLAVDAAAQLGPVRLLAWGRLVWVLGDDARQDGSDIASVADELHLGVGVRLGRNHHYWGGANAGVGPYLGATLTEALFDRSYGVVLGLDMWGGG